ncbi:hypothetical protein [Ectobacillus ponti]|uniref:Uncharacterized protein n=1 Tax=Ectobacillus ponti TaxID=2961894 RepID=A0AA41X6K5_9BACI|nr:hypothetical protein [Ectobacillus ponti]MCP8969884.1 hypothetical protein [Ectobacillus ponti]
MKAIEQREISAGGERAQKEVWKLVLRSISGQQLYQLTERLHVSLPGFRRLELKQMEMLRGRITAELLKPRLFHKVKQEFHELYEKANPPELQLTREEIWQQKHDTAFVAHLLPMLISSGDEEKERWAEELFLQQEQPAQAEKPAQEGSVQELKTIIKQLEVKNKKYADKQLEQQTRLLQAAKKQKQLEEELRRQEQQHQALKKQMEQMKKQKEELEGKLQAAEQGQQELRQQLKLQAQESEQLRRLMEAAVYAQETAAASSEKDIAIVGEVHGLDDDRCRVIAGTDLEEAMQQGWLLSCRFVCLLRFSLAPASIRKAKRMIAKEKLREFADMWELEQFLQKEVAR